MHLLAIVRSAIGGGHALDRLRLQVAGAMQEAGHGQDVQRQIRLSLAMSHLFGVALARHIAGLAPLATLPFERLVVLVAPAVELHLTATG